VGASIGIEQALDEDDFVNSLVRADLAMYQIKHSGKNGAAIGAMLLSG